jgi:heptosyltransferase III
MFQCIGIVSQRKINHEEVLCKSAKNVKILNFEGQMTYGNYPELKQVKRILVVKLRHLGDVLLTGPVFHALKQAIPQAEVDAYIYQEALPMLEGHPDIDRLISYDRNWKRGSKIFRISKELGLLREIRKREYDLVINLTEGDRGVIAALVSKAKIRAGFPPKGKWQQKALTHIAKECPSLRHTVERNLDVVRRIGIFPPPESRDLYLHLPETAREKAKWLAGEASFVLIHPTSRWRFKCWPAPKMRQLAEWLLKEGKRVIVTSGPDPIEKEMASEISQGLDILNLGGQLSLKELGALIDRAKLLICVDSVSFHMASALKKPVVALFGPTSDVTWGPWRNPHAHIVSMEKRCRPCYLDGCGGSKRSDCLESLPLETVLCAVDSLFRERKEGVLQSLQFSKNSGH